MSTIIEDLLLASDPVELAHRARFKRLDRHELKFVVLFLPGAGSWSRATMRIRGLRLGKVPITRVRRLISR